MKWSMKLFFYFNRNKKAELIVTTNSKLYAIKFIAPYGRLSRFKFDNKRRLFIRDYHIRGGASMTRIDFPYDFDFQRKMLETIAFKHNIEEVVICLAFIPANLGVYSGDDDCVTHISGDTVGGIKLFVSAKELYNYIITDVAEFPKQQTVQLKEEIKQMKNV